MRTNTPRGPILRQMTLTSVAQDMGLMATAYRSEIPIKSRRVYSLPTVYVRNCMSVRVCMCVQGIRQDAG